MPDPIIESMVTSAPELSATSDLPSSATPDPTPAEPSPSPAPPAPAPEPTAPPDGKQDFRGRLSEMAAQRRAAEQRADTLAASLEKALDALGKVTAPAAAPVPATEVQKRPQRADFDDPDTYEDALIDWSSQKAAAAAEARLEKRLADDRKAAEEAVAKKNQDSAATDLQRRWNDKVTAAVAKMPDFREVAIDRDDLTITPVMGQTIMDSENGAEIAYHLGQNPQEAARIAALPPARQVFEIGVLSATLAVPKPGAITRAPDPITRRVGSGAAALPRNPTEMSMEEYGGKRLTELQRERRPFMNAGSRA